MREKRQAFIGINDDPKYLPMKPAGAWGKLADGSRYFVLMLQNRHALTEAPCSDEAVLVVSWFEMDFYLISAESAHF